MSQIRFANGETHNCTLVSTIPSDTKAYIAIDDVSFAQAAEIFSDESKTATMEWNGFRLVGYTKLVDLGVTDYGYQACLRGGHDERI